MPIGSFRLNTLAKALAAAAPVAPTATGGTITYPTISGTTYKVHTFTAGTNNFVVTSGGTVDFLLIGAGGAGGGAQANYASGGGGAGQVKQQFSVAVTSQTYSIVVPDTTNGAIGSNGLTGGSATAFGVTAFGGSGGSANGTGPSNANGAAGGGAGSNFSTSVKSGGTGTFAGGSAKGTGMSGYSGGGGGGSTSAGGNGDSTVGGNGGNGTTFTDFHVAGSVTYAGGGGAGGTDARGSGGGGGGGPGILNANNNTAGAATNYGSGGGGTVDQGGSNRFGGNGFAGVAFIRYPITPVTSMTFVVQKGTLSSASGNFTLPLSGTAPDFLETQAGDIAILFDTSTSTGDVTPSGWTSISTVTTTGIRQSVSYKILTAGDLSATFTGMASVNRKVIMVYRGNTPINTVIPTIIGSQATTAVPTAQSLVGEAGPVITFAVYSSTGAITTRGWSVGSPVEYSSVSTSSIYVRALLTNSGTPSTTSITMSDGGTNALQTFRMKFI